MGGARCAGHRCVLGAPALDVASGIESAQGYGAALVFCATHCLPVQEAGATVTVTFQATHCRAPRPPLWRAPLPLSVFHEAGVAVHSMGSRMGMDRPCPPPNTRFHHRPGAFCAPCAAALCSSAATATAASATAAQGARSRPEVAPSVPLPSATRTAVRAATLTPHASGNGALASK